MHRKENVRLERVQVGEVLLSSLWHLGKRGSPLFAMCLFGCWLLSCSASGTAAEQKAEQQILLTQLHWCGKPMQIFRDEGAVAFASPTKALPEASPTPSRIPVTLKDWAQAKQSLSFHLYLPDTLPVGTCLMSAYGTVHDPIFGSSFTIAYLLPDHGSLSLSEAPLRSLRTDLQCSPITIGSTGGKGSAEGINVTPVPQSIQLCSGVKNTTSIVFSAQWSSELLRKFFQNLQEKNEWLPLAETATGNTLDAHTVL